MAKVITVTMPTYIRAFRKAPSSLVESESVGCNQRKALSNLQAPARRKDKKDKAAPAKKAARIKKCSLTSRLASASPKGPQTYI
eukprot:897335-Pelagomonas_calceolata.AAC.4